MLGLVGPNGERIDAQDVVAHMQANGVPAPGFLTHAPGARARGPTSRTSCRRARPAARGARARRRASARTAWTAAAIEASMVGARRGARTRSQASIASPATSGSSTRTAGVHAGEAERYADEYHNARNAPEQREELVPVQVGSARYTPERLKQIEDAQASGTAPDLKRPDGGEGPCDARRAPTAGRATWCSYRARRGIGSSITRSRALTRWRARDRRRRGSSAARCCRSQRSG
jgi:hypothetical protein